MVAITNAKSLYNRLLFISITVLIILTFNYVFFYEVYSLTECSFFIFEKTIKISTKYWKLLKVCHLFSIFISWSFILNGLYPKFSRFLIFNDRHISKPAYRNPLQLELTIGNNLSTLETVTIPELGLYQNILITGTIGTGKTSSAMYPFTKQLLSKNLGMLILDVKGNYHNKVKEIAKEYNRTVRVIELNGIEKYNPLDKPNLKPSIIANRLRTILTLFSNQNTTDTYWLDKVETLLTEAITLCRLYNNGYVTFVELHKIIFDQDYLTAKLKIIKQLFLENKLTKTQIFELNACLEFFNSEYKNLDSRVLSIIQSETSRITQLFVNDLDIKNTFCPPQNEITFKGFQNLNNEIVVLNMNVAEYRNLSKILATYLKLDFESEVLMRLANSTNISPVAFLCDEYHEYVTLNDADFFSQSREAKCINIVSTQSYTSLLNALKNDSATKVIIQSLVNKIWFRTDDSFTIEEAQKQLGKEDKIKYLRSISENAKETKFNYLIGSFKSDNSNLSESISTQINHDFIFDTNTFSSELKTFEAVCFITTGKEILAPQLVKLIPYFNSKNTLNKKFI